jgi:hypothetical protein
MKIGVFEKVQHWSFHENNMRIKNSEVKKECDVSEFGQDTSMHLLVWKEKIRLTQKYKCIVSTATNEY